MRSFVAAQPIAKGESNPADITRLSFLSLPPEIRNMLYSLYCERESPILFEVVRFLVKNRRLLHKVFETALFRTCRQVYHEATSTFYGKNTFTFVSSILPDRAGGELLMQAHGAGLWLAAIGSHIYLPRRLVINLDNYNAPSNIIPYIPGRRRMVELTGLLKVLWANPASKVSFSIFRPGAGRSQPAEALTNAARELVRDVLDIRKYSRLIKYIAIQRDCSAGTVWYGDDSDDFLRLSPQEVERNFNITENGMILEFSEKKELKLPNLPEHIRQRIYEAVTGSEPIPVDLDGKSYCDPARTLTATCHSMRQDNSSFWSHAFEVKMASSKLRTTFHDFEVLRRWLCVDRTEVCPFSASRRRVQALEIVLQFDISCDETSTMPTLQDIRIEIVSLIRVLSHMPERDVGVTLSMISRSRRWEYTSKGTINFGQLRRNVLVVLSKIFEKHPEMEDIDCPDLWMNGNGNIVEMTISGVTRDAPRLLLSDKSALRIREYTCGVEHEKNPYPEWDVRYRIAPPVERYYDGTMGHLLGYLRRVLRHPREAEYWARSCESTFLLGFIVGYVSNSKHRFCSRILMTSLGSLLVDLE